MWLIEKMGFSATITARETWFINKVRIAERTGWSFEYIDNLPFETVQMMIAVWAGEAKAQKKD